MKLYLIEKTASNKAINLGGKITLEKLNTLLNNGNAILIRNIEDGMQSDLRLRKIPQAMKMDRGYKKIKEYYRINLEMGKVGFEAFSPKQVIFEQNLRFASLERALNMLEAKQNLKRADWVIEKVSAKKI